MIPRADSPPLGGPGAEAPEAVEPQAPLRLAVARGELGLELYDKLEFGPLEIGSLGLTLPGLRFPLDLSGGVAKFRHRRGVLQELELRLEPGRLSAWLAPKLEGALGGLERVPDVWLHRSGVGIGLSGRDGAVAFDVHWAPDGPDGRLVIANVRGAGLNAPALLHALGACDAAGLGERRGRVVILPRFAHAVVSAVLPALAVRVPDTGSVRLGAVTSSGEELRVELDAGATPPPLADDTLQALELSALVREPDDALARGDFAAAREGYLLALERAPRHPDIVRLVAEIDVLLGGAPEAALGLIAESVPTVATGWIGAELLARTGDTDSAEAALTQAATGEAYSPVAAKLWVRLAELARHAATRAAAFDRAVARVPGYVPIRWLRFEARVARADVDGALADAQAIEQATRGARRRHEVLRRAARTLLEAGWRQQAGQMFERALRYVPDDAAATAGLARALLAAGRRERAVGLLERAIRLSERSGQADAQALMDLAELLADPVRDLPQAIARLRQVPAASPLSLRARALEGRFREQLGDFVGASLAFARLREAVELAAQPATESAAWLEEAARFELNALGDYAAAERHLSAALRLAPRDQALLGQYRAVAAELARRQRSPSGPR